MAPKNWLKETERFQEWLVKKYNTIEKANRMWKTDFHSFEEVPVPSTLHERFERPIVFIQGVNQEYGMFRFEREKDKYVTGYQDYLKDRYVQIEKLNKVYKSSYPSFERIPNPEQENQGEDLLVAIAKWVDWRNYMLEATGVQPYRYYTNERLKTQHFTIGRIPGPRKGEVNVFDESTGAGFEALRQVHLSAGREWGGHFLFRAEPSVGQRPFTYVHHYSLVYQDNPDSEHDFMAETEYRLNYPNYYSKCIGQDGFIWEGSFKALEEPRLQVMYHPFEFTGIWWLNLYSPAEVEGTFNGLKFKATAELRPISIENYGRGLATWCIRDHTAERYRELFTSPELWKIVDKKSKEWEMGKIERGIGYPGAYKIYEEQP